MILSTRLERFLYMSCKRYSRQAARETALFPKRRKGTWRRVRDVRGTYVGLLRGRSAASPLLGQKRSRAGNGNANGKREETEEEQRWQSPWL